MVETRRNKQGEETFTHAEFDRHSPKNHHLLANDLERILYGEDSKAPSSPRRTYQIPKDGERGLELLSVRVPVRDLKDIVLSDGNKATMEEVLVEQNRTDLLSGYGLKPIHRLLFY